MKNQLKSILLSLVILLVVHVAQAQDFKTFYVCSGTIFTMMPADTTFKDYEWKEVGSATAIATTRNATVTAPTITDTAYTTKRYTLSVRDTGDCWSALDTFTVHYLPEIQVSLSGNAGPYCSIEEDTVKLVATVGGLLLPPGVAADQYLWTENGSGVSSTPEYTFVAGNGATPAITIEVAYSIQSSGGQKVDPCKGSASTTVVIHQTPTTPTISIQ